MYGWKRYRGGVWQSMRTIWQTEGFFGFFRGNSATVTRIMPYSAVQYYSFELYHRMLSEHVFHSDEPHPGKRFIAGSLAGVTSVLCTYPIDLARTVLAVQVDNDKVSTVTKGNNHAATTSATVTANNQTARLGVFSTLYNLVREQGISSIYRGMYPTLVGVVPYAGISFLSFGQLKRAAERRQVSKQHPVLINLVCGACSGLTAQCFTYPFDMVRRRLQALHKPEMMTEQERSFLRAATTSNRFATFSITNAISFILRTEGLKGLYRGISLNFLKTAPAMSISFACYDKVRTALGVPPGKFSATRG